MQTDPTLYRSFDRMLAQGVHFDGAGPEHHREVPGDIGRGRVMEEATYRGVSVNATVSFSVAQAVAAAEAVERGLAPARSRGAGRSTTMGPVITLMMGRLEDWLRVQTERDGIVADPAALPWSGVAVFKRTVRPSSAPAGSGRDCSVRRSAITCHWSELIGGDVVITMPAAWQRRFNASSIEVRPRMDEPVAPAIVDELRTHFPDFVRAYEPDGLTPRRVRHVRADRAHPAGVHRVVPRAAPPGRAMRSCRIPIARRPDDRGVPPPDLVTRRALPAGRLAVARRLVGDLTPDDAGWRFYGTPGRVPGRRGLAGVLNRGR